MKLDCAILNVLSKEYGDAFYILDSEVFRNNCQELMVSFKSYYPKFNIAYSYKTNYTPALVKIVNELGGYAEVVSDMEMEIALRSGVKPDHIFWNGPVKNEEKVKELLLSGGTVNIDSFDEIDNIQKVSANYPDHILNIGVRCNYDVGDGILSRFGVDVDGTEFDEVLRFIKASPNIHLFSLQAHFANRNSEFWTARAYGLLRIYDRVVEKYGLRPECLDLGGGIYGKMPDEFRKQLGIGKITFNDYSSKSAKLFAEHFSDMPDAPYLFIEPGSAVAGDCMKFVARIKTIKAIKEHAIATVIGSQENISMRGLNPPMEIVSCGNEREFYESIDIAGFTCIESDFLYRGYKGKLGIGDYIVISNCGSYSLVMKPPFILPNVPILDMSNGDVKLIKRQENFDDLFHTFCF